MRSAIAYTALALIAALLFFENRRLRSQVKHMEEAIRRRFAEIVLANYVQDGVWTLNRATFTDVLNQLYHGNMPTALADLGFAKPADALKFFGNIQQRLYAA